MPTLNHIGGAEPSTLTFKVRTVSFNQNSSVMHAEVLAIGDPDSTNALAAVLNAVPASTAWGLVTREAGGVLSSLGGIVQIQGNSTVFQGGSPWNVAQVAGSTWTVRAQNSTAADLLATVSQGTNPWTVAGNCTVAPLAGSTWNVRALNSSAADLQVTATPAAGSTWNVRALNSSAADLQVTCTPVAGSTWAVRPIQSSAADLQMTATPLAGSTWNVRALNSSAADLQVTATQSAAVWTVNVGTHIQSTVAPSSNSSGVVVRNVVDNILNVVSSNAFTSTSLTIQSSAASIRSYVTSYSILTTNAGPTKVKFYSGSTLLWPMIFAAVSSAVSGANLAVSAPAYLFRTKTAGPLTLQLGGGGSTVAGWHVAVSYFRAP